MSERLLKIDPSGEISWVSIDRKPYNWTVGDGFSLNQIYAAIDCSCVEQVRTVLPGIVLLVDESGRIKDPPKPHNEIASRLYAGWISGWDDIVGSALICALRPVPPLMEHDWCVLNHAELLKLSLFLGVELPEDK